MKALIIALSVIISGCAANPLTAERPCNPVHPKFDSIEVHDNGNITLTEDQLEDLLIYIDELEGCSGL